MRNDVEYRRPLTDSFGSPWFSGMKRMNDDDVRTMFSIFGQYNTRASFELDASFVRYVEEIHKSLIWPRNYEEIRDMLKEPYKEISLVDS